MIHRLDADACRALLEDAPVGMLHLDRHGKITWLNETLARIVHRPAAELVGKSATEVGDVLRRLFEAPEAIFLPDADDGPGHWLLRTRQVLPDDGGQMFYYVDAALLRELALEREALRERLAELEAVDEVPGLPNRRAMMKKLEPEVSRSRRYDNPLTVILMRVEDLDGLREQWGDDAADQVMLSIAQMLNDQMRWADIIGRWSHEEFLLILPETALEASDQLLAKIRDRLRAVNLDGSGEHTVEVTARFGSVQWRRGEDAALLLERVHEALERDTRAA